MLLTALEVISSNGSLLKFSTLLFTTLTLSKPISRDANFKNEALLFLGSHSVNSISGYSIANIRAGKPAPVPISKYPLRQIYISNGYRGVLNIAALLSSTLFGTQVRNVV